MKNLHKAPLLDLLSNVNMSRICFVSSSVSQKGAPSLNVLVSVRLRLDQANLAERVKGPFLAGLCLIAIS